MVCPQCGAENPGGAFDCNCCGRSLISRRRLATESSREGTAANCREESRATAMGMTGLSKHEQSGPAHPDDRNRPSSAKSRTQTREEDQEDVFRELYAEVVAINHRIKRQKSDVDTEALSGLYTARSFATPEAMGRTTGAIRQMLRTNRRLAVELERALERIKSRVESAHWSRDDKVRFWGKITGGFLARFRMRPAILEKQERWTEATVGLYEFVLAHSEQLSFEGKTVQATDRETGEEFVRLLKRAKQCRNAFRAAAETVSEVRAGKNEHRTVTDPW